MTVRKFRWGSDVFSTKGPFSFFLRGEGGGGETRTEDKMFEM